MRATFSKLNSTQKDIAYKKAIDTLLELAAIDPIDINLEHFTPNLLETQLDLFKEWYLIKYKGIKITSEIESQLSTLLTSFESIFLSAPKTVVHVDYHSRNLLYINTEKIGVIDYQDARVGPIGYDAISLWFDSYIKHTDTEIQQWANYYLEGLNKIPRFSFLTNDMLMELSYLSGLQRLIKNLGIFARLTIKYKKPDYEKYIPKVLDDIDLIINKYPSFDFFRPLLHDKLGHAHSHQEL